MNRILTLVLVSSYLFPAQRSSAQAGNLDLEFNTDGYVFTNLTPNMDVGNAVAVLSDERIVVAGRADYWGVEYGFVACYLTDGTLDNSFGSAGLATTQILGYSIAGFAGMALDAESRIIVAGQGDGRILIMRYLSNGTLDAAFGQNGQVNVELGSSSNAVDVGVDGAGRIIAYVDVSTTDERSIGAVRLLPNGDLDPTFGTDGVATNVVGGGTHPRVLCVYPDGRILIGGDMVYDEPETVEQTLLIRYQDDGTLDNAFGVAGVDTVSVSIGINTERMTDMLIKSDGSLLVAGMCHADFSPQGYVIQLMPDGSFDPTFSVDGQMLIPEFWYGSRLALQPDGKILAAGGELIVNRYNADGTTDLSFGNGGTVTHETGWSVNSVEDACLQPDGKLVLCGEVSNTSGVSNYSVMVARLITAPDVGITGPGTFKTFLLYPNPTADSAEFTYALSGPDRLTAQLRDMQGKVVSTLFTARSTAAGMQRGAVDLSGLANGNYVLVLSSTSASTSIKISLNGE